MPRAFFRNVTTVPLMKKPAGASFQIETDDEGTPVDLFWRKRFAEGAIAPVARTVSTAEPAAAPKPTKKGA